jgi:hypothetical protein
MAAGRLLISGVQDSGADHEMKKVHESTWRLTTLAMFLSIEKTIRREA